MLPTIFAMRHPITTLALVVGLVSTGVLALGEMRVDIFPSLNSPRIYTFLQYSGMSPEQMEGFVVCQFELLYQYIDGVKEIKSRSIQQISLIELTFHPGTNIAQAMGQVVAMATRAISRMPPGTLPPMVMRLDEGDVAIGYLVMRGKTTPPGMIADAAQNLVRPLLLQHVPGTVAISPYGPNVRAVMVECDHKKLQTYNLSPHDVTNAVMNGNIVVPAGVVYIKDSMPILANNATVRDVQDLGKIPLKMGKDVRNVYIRDVAKIKDSTDVDYGYAIVNGKNAVYLPVIKKSDASTLKVVSDIHKAMPFFQEVMPKDVKVTFEFDESPMVVEAVKSVATEGLLGAGLTGLMILIFLHDWRSVLVVVANIPLALCGSACGLWLTGNTINIMSLGGMALAIGILVDEATVTIENTHVQLKSSGKVATAAYKANNETAMPRLLALLCILSVFIPALIMKDPLKALFMPLTLGVAFAMIFSYILSSTLVPVLTVYLVKKKEQEQGFFQRMQKVFRNVVEVLVQRRWLVVLAYVVACVLIIGLVGMELGTELFPKIDKGVFVLRFRPPPGSNYKLTREMAIKCLEEIGHEAGAKNVKISMGFVGQLPPNFGMDNIVLFTRGPDDGYLRIALRKESGIRLEPFRERLRKVLPERVLPWLAQRLEKGGLPRDKAWQQAGTAIFGFQPGDLVTQVMSFGALTPIAVRVVGTDIEKVRRHAEKIKQRMERIANLRDVAFKQQLDYPAIHVEVDREKAGYSGATMADVANPLIEATSSSRFIALNYWVDNKTGFDYQVEVLVPPKHMTSQRQVETLPLLEVNPLVNLMPRDIAKLRKGKVLGEIDRAASQRYISINANVVGEDIGRASRQVSQAIAAAGKPPHGIHVHPQGQLPQMDEMFKALGIGLGAAVFVILLLLTAYFQSFRLAFISIGAVPGVIAGVVLLLYVTGTTVNIESFMGSIMCLGVSVSNSVMLVTFMDEHWKQGTPAREAAVKGAGERLRPILMTACAMTIGMVPMSLGLERGSQMEMPLGRAVIGGLLMSTVATLLIVPAIFAIVVGQSKYKSPSVFPGDPGTEHHDPDLDAKEAGG